MGVPQTSVSCSSGNVIFCLFPAREHSDGRGFIPDKLRLSGAPPRLPGPPAQETLSTFGRLSEEPMRNTPVFVLATFTIAAWLSVAAQQSIPSLQSGRGERKLHGRIVLYDWVSHETTSNDDFVVRNPDARAGNPPYARVIYRPFWGFDAPQATPKEVLDRLAFVGKGATWEFTVYAPQTSQELAACSAPIVNHKYENENGSGELPRFIPTPGAEGANVPSVASLPCFILNRGGLKRDVIVGNAIR